MKFSIVILIITKYLTLNKKNWHYLKIILFNKSIPFCNETILSKQQ